MKKTQHGFSLIELAIVLVIVTILIGGLAVPLSAQIEARRIAETRKLMEEARDALMGYAMTHSCSCAYDNVGPGGILLPGPTTCAATSPIPCPANNPSTNSTTLKRPYLPCPDTDENGTENRPAGAECLQPRGYFPWVSLGTASQDAWGNRLWYEVTDPYSDATKGFSNGSTGDIQICDASGCARNIASNVPVTLVSHGPNGWGALNINGNTLATPTSADELENNSALTNGNKVYISRAPSKADSALGEFDDLVTWISTPLLISRVCPSPGGCL